jgi:hypothetical protein
MLPSIIIQISTTELGLGSRLDQHLLICEKWNTKANSGDMLAKFCFGWTRSGDSLFWQAHFIDGEALRFHLQAVRGLYDALIEGDERPTDLIRFELHGPESELEKCRGITQGLDPIYFFPEQRMERIKED